MAGGDGCVLLQPTSLDSGGVNSFDTDLDLHITLFARNALNSLRLQGRTYQITETDIPLNIPFTLFVFLTHGDMCIMKL
jgi:hypothetical protein